MCIASLKAMKEKLSIAPVSRGITDTAYKWERLYTKLVQKAIILNPLAWELEPDTHNKYKVFCIHICNSLTCTLFLCRNDP